MDVQNDRMRVVSPAYFAWMVGRNISLALSTFAKLADDPCAVGKGRIADSYTAPATRIT